MIKKLLSITAALVLFLCGSSAFADSSDEKAASAFITSGKGFLRGIMVTTDGTNAVTLNTYDNISAAGRKLHPTWVVTTAADDRAQYLAFPSGLVPYLNGIYISGSCSGTFAYVVYFDKE